MKKKNKMKIKIKIKMKIKIKIRIKMKESHLILDTHPSLCHLSNIQFLLLQ